MRKVIRPRIPKSLAEHSKKWTKELLDAIAKSKKNKIKVPDKFYNKYKNDDVLEALKLMYGDGDFSYCCYCESIINEVSYEQIEHRMPKRNTLDKYPQETFAWKNLHLACPKCNGHKGNKYDESEPILDAVIDNIEEHLGYKLNPSAGVLRETLSRRGITTVEHADLDRDSLRKSRLKLWIKTVETIDEIIKRMKDPRAYTAIKALRYECNGVHGSLIKYLMDSKGIWK